MIPIDRGDLKASALIVDVDLATPGRLPDLDVHRFSSIWCLARRDGHPVDISFWNVLADDRVDGRELRERVQGSAPEAPIGASLLQPDQQEPSDVTLTVVLCTRERPNDLRRALASLGKQSDPDFILVVVDNAPFTDDTRRVTEESDFSDVVYVVAPERGLSRARNVGLDQVGTSHVAWFDDDEVADVDWVRRIKEGFAHSSSPAAVCGVMLPAELESEAQVRFEQFGGFNKGRGLAPEVLRDGTPSVLSTVYPLPAIGSGGNMAFRVGALRGVGGFDPSLGAGTRTHGGEETRALALLLRAGETVLHWPSAMTWHYHRATMGELHRQFYGYSAGLTAFFASMIRSEPKICLELPRLVPHALRDLGFRSGGQRSDRLPSDFPMSLLRESRRGLLNGSFRYVQEAWSAAAGARRR